MYNYDSEASSFISLFYSHIIVRQSSLFKRILINVFWSGYGHVNPVGPYGKMTCILFALVGIPFTLVFLSALGKTLDFKNIFRLAGVKITKIGVLARLFKNPFRLVREREHKDRCTGDKDRCTGNNLIPFTLVFLSALGKTLNFNYIFQLVGGERLQR
jgi:hypothetical protein